MNLLIHCDLVSSNELSSSTWTPWKYTFLRSCVYIEHSSLEGPVEVQKIAFPFSRVFCATGNGKGIMWKSHFKMSTSAIPRVPNDYHGSSSQLPPMMESPSASAVRSGSALTTRHFLSAAAAADGRSELSCLRSSINQRLFTLDKSVHVWERFFIVALPYPF